MHGPPANCLKDEAIVASMVMLDGEAWALTITMCLELDVAQRKHASV
jgi:hypothetical protein